MNVLFHNIYDSINQDNNLFETSNVSIGDNLLSPFNLLGKEAEKLNVNVGTYAKIPLEEAEVVVFIDHPNINDRIFKYAQSNGIKMFLISLESPIVSKNVLNKTHHQPFFKVFTWSDELVASNPEKYIKINYTYDIRINFDIETRREKDFVIIAGNKKSSEKNELYSVRLHCIKWFEKHYPNSLDLFGFGWKLTAFNNDYFLGRIFTRINRRLSFFKNEFKVYKGSVDRKHEVLKNYNYSICFENVFGYSGYITEKIFDCFLAGTIPIYKGAPNILDHIPSNCIIMFDDFKDLNSMYDYLINISEATLIEYRDNIRTFLTSQKIKNFQNSFFASTILNEINSLVK